MSVLRGFVRWISRIRITVAVSLILCATATPAAAASNWEKLEGDVLRYAGYTLAFAQDCGLDSSQSLLQVMLYIGWTTENERETKSAGNYLKRMIAEGKARNGGSDWPCTVVKGSLTNKVKQFAAANKKRISLDEGMEYNVFNDEQALLHYQDLQIAKMQIRAKKCCESANIIIGHMYRVHMIYTADPSSISERLKRFDQLLDLLKDKDEEGACKSKSEEDDELMEDLFTTLDYIA